LTVVFDTNVLVSALLIKTSVPRQAFEQAALNGTILVSLATYAELSQVLSRQKFARYLSESERL
jgi:predicted nucleic acid-binding protein